MGLCHGKPDCTGKSASTAQDAPEWASSEANLPQLEGLLKGWLNEEQLERRGDEETCEWLNFVMTEIWPYLNTAVKDNIKSDLEPAIQEAVPSLMRGVHFGEFSLGSSPPVFGPIVSYTKTRQKEMGIELDVGFKWACDGHIELVFPPTNVCMGLTSLTLKGEVSVLLKPLMKSLPVLGGLQIFMISPPELAFVFSGALSSLNCESFASRLRQIISDQLCKHLVLPNRVFLHWVWGREDEIDIATMQQPPPEGVIRLGLVEARGLEGMDWNLFSKRTSDPLAMIRVGARSHRTPTLQATCDPVWGDTGYGDFFIYNLKQAILIELFDGDIMPNNDDRLGDVRRLASGESIRLMDVMAKPDAWWPVCPQPGKQHGEVRLVAEVFELRRDRPGLIRKPLVQPRGNAKATALLSVQILALRGLSAKVGEGAKIQVTVGDHTRVTKGATYVVPHLDQLEASNSPDEIAVATKCQRLVEFMHLEKYPISRIAQVAGLTEEEVNAIIKARPSFATHWQESFHILLDDPLDAKVQLELLLEGKNEIVTVARLAAPFDVTTVLDTVDGEMRQRSVYDLVPIQLTSDNASLGKDAVEVLDALGRSGSSFDLDAEFCWLGFNPATS
jgi:hypothetical protein